jgi:sugar phosphate permease
MVRAALRRLSILLVTVAAGTAAFALLVGLAAGAGVWRSVSVGWYLAGSVLLIGGFFVGNRGPTRPQGEGWSPFSMKRWSRWASAEEQRESISLSAILVVLGFVLILLGVVADTRYRLI